MSVEYPGNMNPFDDEETEEEAKFVELLSLKSMPKNVPILSVPLVIASHLHDKAKSDISDYHSGKNDEPEVDMGPACEDTLCISKNVSTGVASEKDKAQTSGGKEVSPSPFDPPPRPPPPRLSMPLSELYNEALNPFNEDDEGEGDNVLVETKPPSAPKSLPRRYKKKAPPPPLKEERPTSRISIGSLDSSGSGTPQQKKKPAPNAPIPPKRVFPDGFKDKLTKELQAVEEKLDQLSCQRDSIKDQLSIFGVDDAVLQDHHLPREEEESPDKDDVIMKNNKNDREHHEGDKKDVAREGAKGSTAAVKETEEEKQEVDTQDAALVLDKLMHLALIGEEIEDLKWRQKEVSFDLKDLALNEQHAELDHQIRVIQAQPLCIVSLEEKCEEAELIERMIQVVKQRDELVEQMEADRNLRSALNVEENLALLHMHHVGGDAVVGCSSSSSSSLLLAASMSPAAGDKGKRKYKLPKLKYTTLKKIKDKVVHHHHSPGSNSTTTTVVAPENSKRRSYKKS